MNNTKPGKNSTNISSSDNAINPGMRDFMDRLHANLHPSDSKKNEALKKNDPGIQALIEEGIIGPRAFVIEASDPSQGITVSDINNFFSGDFMKKMYPGRDQDHGDGNGDGGITG